MADDHEHEDDHGHGIRRCVDWPDGRPCFESTEFPGLRGRGPERLAEAATRIRTCGAELILSRMELTSLPAELGQCAGLKALSCGDNQLTELLAWFGQCASLERLYCTFNQITKLPAKLGHCVSLEELSCGINQIAELPAELGQCTRLKFLYCRCNRLTKLPAELGRCSLLKTLDCGENSLAEGTPHTPGELRMRWEEVKPHTKSAAKQ